jgi:hypothetical protein
MIHSQARDYSYAYVILPNLEGILYADDEAAYNLYEEARYFEGYNYFE